MEYYEKNFGEIRMCRSRHVLFSLNDKREVAACRSVRSPASALVILRVDGASSSLGLHALFVRG